jgi:hypothetical protein
MCLHLEWLGGDSRLHYEVRSEKAAESNYGNASQLSNFCPHTHNLPSQICARYCYLYPTLQLGDWQLRSLNRGIPG